MQHRGRNNLGNGYTERYDRVEMGERRQAVGRVIEFANLATKVGG